MSDPSERLVGDIVVRDQDEQPLHIAGAYRGVGATVIYVDVDKPRPPLNDDETRTAICAALLGLNLARPVVPIADDIHRELTRMGYELRSAR